jgi:hypothetical protein
MEQLLILLLVLLLLLIMITALGGSIGGVTKENFVLENDVVDAFVPKTRRRSPVHPIVVSPRKNKDTFVNNDTPHQGDIHSSYLGIDEGDSFAAW